jgi:hypothetical protein
MKLSEKLLTVAAWLESTENDLIVSTSNDEHLTIVANALVKASEALQDGAEEISKTEEGIITPESLDEMAALATAFDESDDEMLKKQASVLDEILITLAAPKNAIAEAKKAEDDRIEQLKKKYNDVKPQLDEVNRVAEAEKALEKSPKFQEAKIHDQPLSTRTCRRHPGAQLQRIGERQFKCLLDGEVYNYEEYGSVANQIPLSHDVGRNVFDTQSDTRSDRLGTK